MIPHSNRQGHCPVLQYTYSYWGIMKPGKLYETPIKYITESIDSWLDSTVLAIAREQQRNYKMCMVT